MSYDGEDEDPNPPPEPNEGPRNPPTQFYLDAALIFRRLELVGYQAPGVTLLVTDTTVSFFRRKNWLYAPERLVMCALKKALGKGFIEEVEGVKGQFRFRPLPKDQSDLLRHLTLRKAEAALVTDDRRLERAAWALDITTLGSDDLVQSMAATGGLQKDPDILRRAKFYRLATLLMGMCAVIVALGLAWIAVTFGDEALTAVWNSRAAIAWLAVPIGLGLVFWKTTEPMSYGLLEVVAGGATAHFAASEIKQTDQPSLALALPMLAGLYIVVRGVETLMRATRYSWVSTLLNEISHRRAIAWLFLRARFVTVLKGLPLPRR